MLLHSNAHWHESENGRKIEVWTNFSMPVLSPDKNWNISTTESLTVTQPWHPDRNWKGIKGIFRGPDGPVTGRSRIKFRSTPTRSRFTLILTPTFKLFFGCSSHIPNEWLHSRLGFESRLRSPPARYIADQRSWSIRAHGMKVKSKFERFEPLRHLQVQISSQLHLSFFFRFWFVG